ncbi:MAG: hypothetical protein WAL95_15795 [Candidatus Acidiferrales bacterium]
MPLVFIIARDWQLRAGLRAELRERGIDALGMDSAEDAGRSFAEGQMPAVVVLEATAEFAADASIQSLIKRVPTILIASRTETVPLPPAAAVFYRPVTIGEITTRVLELLKTGHPA